MNKNINLEFERCMEECFLLKLIQYNFKYPYDSEVYRRIANTYIGEEKRVITKKVDTTIKINYIHQLSWHELQLLRGGVDRFTSMVNLYNQFAYVNNVKQIINTNLLKERIDILKKHEYYEESAYIENFLIEYSIKN